MKRIIYLLNVMLMMTIIGCTKTGQEKDAGDSRAPGPKDTIHTRQAAMNIYGYQPVKALQIIDEAVAVGNLSDWQADMCRARIYSASLTVPALIRRRPSASACSATTLSNPI